MVLHADYYLQLHGEPRSLPNCRKDDYADRKRRRPGRPTGHLVRNARRWLNNDIFSCKYSLVFRSASFSFLIRHFFGDTCMPLYCTYLCHQIPIHYIECSNVLVQDSKIGIYQKMWRFMEVSFPLSFPSRLHP